MNIVIIAIIIFASINQFSSFTDTDIELFKIWETDSIFLTPESVVFDSLRNCLYVSNYNDKGGFRKKADTIFDECISKVDLDGNIIDFRWIDSLIGPTGITIYNDTLYVVERGYLTLINVKKRLIEKRISIKNSEFLNDIVIDKNGDIYISDTRKRSIYKFRNNKYELWLSDTLLEGINGLYIDNDKLIVGAQGNDNLISVSIPDKEIKVIASNISKGIDGIKRFKQDYILSWGTKILLVGKFGSSQIILNTENEKDWCADFELIESKNIIIVPTLLSNKLKAYEIKEER